MFGVVDRVLTIWIGGGIEVSDVSVGFETLNTGRWQISRARSHRQGWKCSDVNGGVGHSSRDLHSIPELTASRYVLFIRSRCCYNRACLIIQSVKVFVIRKGGSFILESP